MSETPPVLDGLGLLERVAESLAAREVDYDLDLEGGSLSTLCEADIGPMPLIVDVAGNLFNTDHSASLPGVQNVIVHTIGFDVPEGTTLLTNAATNGGGNFYTASNAAELEQAMLDAISIVLEETFTFSQPLFPSTSYAGGDQVYMASFEPSLTENGRWRSKRYGDAYATAVNVHNPHYEHVRYRRKLALGAHVSKFVEGTLGPDEATAIDCRRIVADYGPFIHGVEGFLVIESTHSLDVIAVYTAGRIGRQVVSIDVEDVRERALETG